MGCERAVVTAAEHEGGSVWRATISDGTDSWDVLVDIHGHQNPLEGWRFRPIEFTELADFVSELGETLYLPMEG